MQTTRRLIMILFSSLFLAAGVAACDDGGDDVAEEADEAVEEMGDAAEEAGDAAEEATQ